MQSKQKNSESTLKVGKGPGKGMDRQKAVTIRLNTLGAQKKR